jgi:hypothetical protein
MGAAPVDWSVNWTIKGELPCVALDMNRAVGAPVGNGITVAAWAVGIMKRIERKIVRINSKIAGVCTNFIGFLVFCL